jgi:hypothetical protein
MDFRKNSPFADSELCGTIAKEAITSLQAASAKLEQLAELTAVAGRRRRSKNHNQPQLPL